MPDDVQRVPQVRERAVEDLMHLEQELRETETGVRVNAQNRARELKREIRKHEATAPPKGLRVLASSQNGTIEPRTARSISSFRLPRGVIASRVRTYVRWI